MNTDTEKNNSDTLLEEILKMDPAIKAANDKLEQLKNDPEVMRIYHIRERALREGN